MKVRDVRVLIAEDDPLTRNGLVELLTDEGYEVIQAENGEEAIEKYQQFSPNFVCLDVMMPRVSGYEVCRYLRGLDTQIPIIFISAKSQEIDKVAGLELGADDFIVKPFGVKEVMARIRAVTRRCMDREPSDQNLSFKMGDLEVRPAELRALRGDQAVDLSLRDLQILRLLHACRGAPVSRQMIFEKCWGLKNVRHSRTLDQHISQLRKRIELDPKQPQIIKTVHGVGYRFE